MNGKEKCVRKIALEVSSSDLSEELLKSVFMPCIHAFDISTATPISKIGKKVIFTLEVLSFLDRKKISDTHAVPTVTSVVSAIIKNIVTL